MGTGTPRSPSVVSDPPVGGRGSGALTNMTAPAGNPKSGEALSRVLPRPSARRR